MKNDIKIIIGIGIFISLILSNAGSLFAMQFPHSSQSIDSSCSCSDSSCSDSSSDTSLSYESKKIQDYALDNPSSNSSSFIADECIAGEREEDILNIPCAHCIINKFLAKNPHWSNYELLAVRINLNPMPNSLKQKFDPLIVLTFSNT